MKVPYIFSYLKKNPKNLLSPYKLNNNTKLIIDGRSVAYYLLMKCQRYDSSISLLGGEYTNFYVAITNFFKILKRHKVDVLVVFDGAWTSAKYKHYINSLNFRYSQQQTLENIDGNDAVFQGDIFLDVVIKMEIKFLKCIFDATNTISIISKILNCPILTSSADFIYYNIPSIFFDFQTHPRNREVKLTCKIFHPDEFVKKFPGLQSSCLPLLAVLLGREALEDRTFEELLKTEFTHDIENRDDKFDAALNFLCNHSLDSAAEEIYLYLVSKNNSSELSKKLIEDVVNTYNFSTISDYMIHHLSNFSTFKIDEKQILEMKKKFVKFELKIDDEKNVLQENECVGFENMKITSDEEKIESVNADKVPEKINNDEEDVNLISKNFEKVVPAWFIQEYLSGKFDGFVINLIEHNTYFPWYQLENLNYPSIHEITVPLVTLIYRLVMSCIDIEQIKPIKIILRKNTDISFEEIAVEKYPTRLEDIRKSNLTIRRKILNDALKLKESSTLEDFPENWQLYIATIIFWMKSETQPEKNKTHLYALLFAMLFAIVDDKVGGYNHFQMIRQHFPERLNRICRKNIVDCNNENLTLIEALKKINQDDAMVTEEYFLQMYGNLEKPNGEHFDNLAIGNLTISPTIHIYKQFQCCQKCSKNLNALLDFPYSQTNIKNVFNGSLICGLFINISKHSQNADRIFSNMFDNALTVQRVFKLLKEKVEALLE